MNDDAIDAAAEDAPTLWVAVAALGLLVALCGVGLFVIAWTGVGLAVVAAIPGGAVLLTIPHFVVLVGLGAFVLAMTEWAPPVGPTG